MTVHPFIEAEKRAGHSVKRTCELMKVSRTAFYTRRSGLPGPRVVQVAELTEQILEAHAKSRGTYAAPRVHAALKREGAGCGRRRVARLMRAAGLQGRHCRRRHETTVADPGAAFRPDLIVRDFQPDRTGLDVRWCGDITCVPTEEGWHYLATVIDIASRRVVGVLLAHRVPIPVGSILFLAADGGALVACTGVRRAASNHSFRSVVGQVGT
ncbi:IS3 family transposase [Streptomyces sp. NPDC001981]|uniref:IS3 family transposase n=1 Tax=Streptomyces sp. NPDC001981 TaxID=3364628 RepID=UPI0036D2031E